MGTGDIFSTAYRIVSISPSHILTITILMEMFVVCLHINYLS